jgi:hypothetical protein
MNVQTFSFAHFNPSVTRPGSVMDLQNSLLTIFGSSHFLNDWERVQEMWASGLTEIGAALEEICQNHIPSHIPKQIEISRMTIARILPACPVED